MHDLAFRPHYKPDCMKLRTHTSSRQSVYSNIRHSSEGQLTAVELEHPLTSITLLYRGLIFLPIEVT